MKTRLKEILLKSCSATLDADVARYFRTLGEAERSETDAIAKASSLIARRLDIDGAAATRKRRKRLKG